MKYKLVCFDLDGTLVDDTIFIWHTLHGYFGTDPARRKAKAEEFFKGEITYAEWAGWEIEEWKAMGADKARFMEAIRELTLMDGARETLSELKKKGCALAIISGSLSFVVDKIIPDHSDIFSDILINRIYFDQEGKIISCEFTEYDMERKADGLRMLAERHGITMEECAFIGDHDNDLEIASAAGLSISFNSKSEKLDKIADVVIKEKDLRRILPFLT